MKTRFNRLFSRMLSNKGYTIDQTILIVAIIAILITLVIVTVGWQLINRAGGTKAGAQLKQIEDANGQFFSDQRTWPHAALSTGNSAVNAIYVLTGIPTTWASNIDTTRIKNLIPGFKLSGSTITHSFGGGGAITQMANTYPSTANIGVGQRLVVQFAAVPIADAKEADRSIDGEENNATGRVLYGDAACLNTANGGAITAPTAPTKNTVFVCYAANTIS